MLHTHEVTGSSPVVSTKNRQVPLVLVDFYFFTIHSSLFTKYHSSHFPKAPTHMETQQPIAPSGRELSPQVTEGACGRQADGLRMGWYLPEVIVTRLEPFCLLFNRLSASACQRGHTFLLRQESMQRSRLKGGTTHSRSNCSPLKNHPGGTIGRLTLRFGSGW